MTVEESFRIVPPGSGRDGYFDLLLLADESEDEVRGYYQTGDLYALSDGFGARLGITLVIPKEAATAELKAVAVAPDRQGQRVGQRMLKLVLDDLRSKKTKRVIVGTSNSGIGQIAFYQKAGFRLWKVERDFFTPARGYAEGLTENGIPLRDMIWFDQDLG